MQLMPGIILIVAISFFIAGIIKLTAPLPIKILISSSAIFLYFVVFKINYLAYILEKILYFQRVSYIATEKKRLDPEDNTPARDILVEDVKEESAYQEIEWDFGGRKYTEAFSWVVILLAVVVFTAIILMLWPVLASSLTSLYTTIEHIHEAS